MNGKPNEETSSALPVNISKNDQIVEANLKSPRVLMVDHSTSSHIITTDSPNTLLTETLTTSSHSTSKQCKLIDLVANDRDIPDFLAQSDDEDVDIGSVGKQQSIVFSRTTQTNATNVENDTNILRTSDLNHPATILSSSTRQISTPNTQTNQELILTKSQLYNVHRNYQTLKMRFHKLHAEYYNLIGLTRELTYFLECSVKGQPVDLPIILQNCMEKYPDLFSPNIRDNLKILDRSLMVSDSELAYVHENLKKSMLSTVPLSPKLLDFKKIKLHLINGNIKTKQLLLQALRWKITLSQPGERDDAILEYISNDLLGIHGQSAGDSGKSILSYLLIPIDVILPHPVQQSAARLLNTFASMKCGRNYLAVGPCVLNVVVQCLDSTRAESIDAFTCDMILATLQKLSLRKHQRLYMIAAGLVEWLIHHLKAECHSMGTYRLEYATALLMNLSLHKEAQIRAAAMPTIVISTLIILLSLNHLPALTYVNGALNNFLANSAINEEAKVIGLGSILEYHRKNRYGELRKHLDHILLRHRRKNNTPIDEEINEDDDREEKDILEEELDEMDPVKHTDDLIGETLLSTCYSLQQHVVQVTHQASNRSSSSISNNDIINENMIQQTSDLSIDKSISHQSRLTPIDCKLNFRNPMKLKILVLMKKSCEKTSIEEIRKQMTISNDSRSSLMSTRSNEITIPSILMLDQSYSSISPDKKYIEKVNSFGIARDNEFFSIEKKITSEVKYNLENKNHADHVNESRMTTMDFRISATSTDDVIFKPQADIENVQINNTASLNAHNETDLTADVTAVIDRDREAFAAKPRLSRTPPQSGASTKSYHLP